MTSLKQHSLDVGLLAVAISREHYHDEMDAYGRIYIERAVEALLEAKRNLAKAHRQIERDEVA